MNIAKVPCYGVNSSWSATGSASAASGASLSCVRLNYAYGSDVCVSEAGRPPWLVSGCTSAASDQPCTVTRGSRRLMPL